MWESHWESDFAVGKSCQVCLCVNCVPFREKKKSEPATWRSLGQSMLAQPGGFIHQGSLALSGAAHTLHTWHSPSSVLGTTCFAHLFCHFNSFFKFFKFKFFPRHTYPVKGFCSVSYLSFFFFLFNFLVKMRLEKTTKFVSKGKEGTEEFFLAKIWTYVDVIQYLLKILTIF